MTRPAADPLAARMVIVAGKGGVGRTTVAAALALLGARRGRRVLLAQARSRDRLSRLFGARVDERVRHVDERIWAVNMTPDAALLEYGSMVLRSQKLARALMERPAVASFLRAIPGLDDYALLGKAWWHTTEERDGLPRFETVILDGPATGHLVAMLRLPRVILDAVPPGPLARDARLIQDLLCDPARARVHLVTLPEEMPVSEAADLCAAVRDDLGLPLGWLVVNRLLPDRFPDGSPAARLLAAIGEDPSWRGLAAPALLARDRRRLQDRHLRRLAEQVPLPQVRLPALLSADLSRDDVERLAGEIDRQTSPAAAGTPPPR